jgi:hypothetical protein
MWTILAIRTMVLSSLGVGLAASVQGGREEDPVPSPGVLEVSAAEQSRWLDQNIPKVVAAMAESPEVHAKVADRLTTENAPPFPLTPVAAGLAPGALERWSALADASVAVNPRYGPGAKARPRPVVAVMPHTGIVRAELTYPARSHRRIWSRGR